MSKHNKESSYREKLIEHLFIGELLKLSWLKHKCNLEVASPEVDNAGYDVIAECYGVVRHIQLKASHTSSSTNSQKVHIKLADKPSGCLIWVIFNEDTLVFDRFLYYGGIAGEPLPSLNELKVAKHTKGNKDGVKTDRPNIRVINKGQFEVFKSVHALFSKLFLAADFASDLHKQNLLYPYDDSEFTKLHRIEKWANNPSQKNTQLLRNFLYLEASQAPVTLKELIKLCIEKHGSSDMEWKNNFNSMKSDHGNSHGKVFYVTGEYVYLYEEVRKEVQKYFKRYF